MSYIPALIIQQESSVFVNSGTGVVGQTGLIPTPASGGQVDSDYWATPITNFGIIGTGFQYTPTTAASTDKPDVQSFHVVRVITSKESTDWYVLGTSTQYVLASEDAECCTISSPPAIMPTASSLPVFAPCQIICNVDGSGNYIGILGAPTLGAGEHYFPKGYFNGVALPAATAAGYTTGANLLTFLNTATTGWAAVGTWTKSSDNLTFTVTQTDGTGTDVLCAAIGTVTP